jgi:dihydrofolate reductase
MAERLSEAGGGPNNLVAIVAANPKGVIGRDGDMPWRLSSDLRRFKRCTLGSPIVMGRTTFQSIGRPLPGRRNLVLSTTNPSLPDGVEVYSSLEALVTAVEGEQRVFVIGGATIYDALLPRCDTLLLTRVWTETEGDTRLDIDLRPWRLVHSERVPQTKNDSVPTEFQVWWRIPPGVPPSP